MLVLVRVTTVLLPTAILRLSVFGSLTGDTLGADIVKCAVGPVAWAFTVSESGFEVVCCGLLLSWTPTVKVKGPEAVGVPEMTPVVGLIETPPGPPVIDHV